MVFLLLVCILFQRSLTYLIVVGGIGGLEGIKMASASKQSAKRPANNLILIHIVQLKPMIKAQISGKMVSSGISDEAFVSVYSEKTRLKKLMIILILGYLPLKAYQFWLLVLEAVMWGCSIRC